MTKYVDRYLFLGLLLIGLAFGLVLLPKYDKNRGVEPEDYLKMISSSERYMTTDELAERIIAQDPSIIVVDTRTPGEFKKFALDGAINIPLDSLLTKDAVGYLNQDVYEVVLYSNDNYTSDQAWLLSKRMGFKNLHVLKGGVNKWFSTIINPKEPSETMSKADFELYNLRKATAMYFGVGTPLDGTKTKKKKRKIKLGKKKKRKRAGGC